MAPLPAMPDTLSARELDAARLDLLRRRVTRFSVVLGILILILAALQLIFSYQFLDPNSRPGAMGIALGAVAGLLVICTPLIRLRTASRLTLRGLVWRTIMLVLLAVLSQTMGAAILARGITEVLRPLGYEGTLGPLFPLVVFMACAHTAASLIVPWTVTEACIAPVVLSLTSLVLSIFFQGDSLNYKIVGIFLPILAGIPGVAITLLRAGDLRDLLNSRLIGARYAEVERELGTARKIHERLFPNPITLGPMVMAYRYEPMRQLGGDYLDLTKHADGSFTIALIDVTGHGVAAALAVNRLAGELKRMVGQRPEITPCEIVSALNEYIYLTLSDQQFFATAAVARIHPAGEATLCVAGHPPPMLKRGNGKVEFIGSTASMLGPLPPADFSPQEVSVTLAPADLLLLYTDGAMEVRNVDGRQLGLSGLKDAVCTANGSSKVADVVDIVLKAVDAHRAGLAEDDTLVVAVARS